MRPPPRVDIEYYTRRNVDIFGVVSCDHLSDHHRDFFRFGVRCPVKSFEFDVQPTEM